MTPPLTLAIDLNSNGDPIWPDLLERQWWMGQLVAIVGERNSDKPSVLLRIEFPHRSEVVIAETTLALLLTAADALRERYGDPRN